jgi:hypothetical protein
LGFNQRKYAVITPLATEHIWKMDAHGPCSWMIYRLKHCEFKRSCVELPEGIREDQW